MHFLFLDPVSFQPPNLILSAIPKSIPQYHLCNNRNIFVKLITLKDQLYRQIARHYHIRP